MVVYYVWDIRLHQYHNVLVPFIDGMNPLGGDKAVAVLNIVHPQVDSWEWGRTAPHCWKRQVKVVAYIPYCTGESNGNYSPLSVDLYDSTQVPGKTCAIIPPPNPTNTRVDMD